MGDIAEMYREQEWEEDFAVGGLHDSLHRLWLQGHAVATEKRRVLAQRERDRVWTQRDGTPIAVNDMTDTHLLASARMLRRKGFIGPRTLAAYLGPGPSADMASLAFEQEQRQVFDAPVSPFVDFFEDEIKRRGLPRGGA